MGIGVNPHAGIEGKLLTSLPDEKHDPQSEKPLSPDKSNGLAGLGNMTKGAGGRLRNKFESMLNSDGKKGPENERIFVQLPDGGYALGDPKKLDDKADDGGHSSTDGRNSSMSDKDAEITKSLQEALDAGLPDELRKTVSEKMTSLKEAKTDQEREKIRDEIKDLLPELHKATLNHARQKLAQMHAAEKDEGKREELAKMLEQLDSLESQTDPLAPKAKKNEAGEAGDGRNPGLMPSFPDLSRMSKEELMEYQKQQAIEGMVIQAFLSQLQMLTEIVKKGSDIAARAIG